MSINHFDKLSRETEGKTAWSFFNLPLNMQDAAKEIMNEFGDSCQGSLWPQGDHSIFVQQGCPAVAITSQWFLDNIDTQRITHTPQDDIGIVDSRKLVKLAAALNCLVRILDEWNRSVSVDGFELQ